MSRVLHLPVKTQYFHEIKAGTKTFEFRLTTDHWRKRIEGREFDEVHIKLGYPKAGDHSRTLVRPWRGFELQIIIHPHFGAGPVEVFAIRVN
ncbi:hypothetical protein D3C80_127810 [compost metagenome]